MARTRRYSIEIKRSPDGLPVLFTAADWDDEERRVAFARFMRPSRMPDSATRLYWINIKDQNGVLLLFNTMDWTDDDRRDALAAICRLAGLPEDNCFTAPIEQHEGADKEL
jgi:hypothetical protein